ncbi:MAG: hypothetical protein CVU69_13435 [Deltaproteobacteria bacterium HGW-Deltaproteobacteria-4]|nr:MAG: hypothetical protein CVU69_13435 [Deltaproteobacteria bacterium HGW-Deltaproteobacteria-4]
MGTFFANLLTAILAKRNFMPPAGTCSSLRISSDAQQKTARTAVVVGRFDRYPLLLLLASAMAISPEIIIKIMGAG